MNYAYFFAHLATLLQLLSDELEINLAVIHEITITDGLENDWWIDVDNQLFAHACLLDGKPALSMGAWYGDYQDMYHFERVEQFNEQAQPTSA